MLNNYVFNLNNGIYRLGFSAAAKALEDASEAVGFCQRLLHKYRNKNSSITTTHALSAETIASNSTLKLLSERRKCNNVTSML